MSRPLVPSQDSTWYPCEAAYSAATRFGTHVFAVGGGEDAARLSGVRVRNVKMRIYVLSALAAGLAGIVQASAGVPPQDE